MGLMCIPCLCKSKVAGSGDESTPPSEGADLSTFPQKERVIEKGSTDGEAWDSNYVFFQHGTGKLSNQAPAGGLTSLRKELIEQGSPDVVARDNKHALNQNGTRKRSNQAPFGGGDLPVLPKEE